MPMMMFRGQAPDPEEAVVNAHKGIDAFLQSHPGMKMLSHSFAVLDRRHDIEEKVMGKQPDGSEVKIPYPVGFICLMSVNFEEPRIATPANLPPIPGRILRGQ